MRWLFLFLIFLNLFFYIWQQQQATIKTDGRLINDSSVSTIKLASEQPEIRIPRTIEDTTTDVTIPLETIEQNTVLQDPLTCLYLGGFTNQKQLAVISTYVKKVDREIALETIKLTDTPKIQLYIPIEKTTDPLTIMDQLNKSTINSLLITRGTLKGNINLGVFSDVNAYESIKETLNLLNIAKNINNLPEAASSYWLKIPNSNRTLFTGDVLSDLMKHFPTVQQELMLCNLSAKGLD